MTRLQKATPWLIGLLIASLLMGALLLFADVQYTGNDDTPLLRATMGYWGEPSTFNLRMHAAFSWLLYGLATLWPGVAWYSILQLFLLWISQAVIVKSLMQSARQKGLSVWWGAVAGALFLAAFTVYISCRITFTVTAALCGAAAVFQLASADFSRKRGPVLLGIAGSAALLLSCYFLRMTAVLPAACFYVLLFVFKLVASHSRRALTALFVLAALFAAAVGWQALDIRMQGLADDIAWQQARTELYDYTGFPQTVSDDTLAELGWSSDEFTLAGNWFFLNDNITAEAFETLTAQQAEPDTAMSDRLAAAWDTLFAVVSEGKLRLALLCLLAVALAAALRGGRRTALYLLLALLGGAALLFALAYINRLPSRAVYSVLLPMGAAVYAALFNRKARHRALAIASLAPLAACVMLTVFAVAAQASAAYIAPSAYFTDTTSDLHADLDEIALMNDDMLIIYDLSLSFDHRLFPDTSEGIPQNLMLWGGWTAHTRGWRLILSSFGIHQLDPSLFLRDNVLYASTYDQPTTELMNYIAQGADGTVDWMYYDQWGYVNLFEFDVY